MNYKESIINPKPATVRTAESVNDLPITDDERELLADTHAYQSQAFEVNIAINPLVAAAAPLLTIATQLRDQRQPPELIPLHDSLCYEIKAFETKSRTSGYRSFIILAARYFICVLLDEIILTTAWGENSRWTQQSLLHTFQREAYGDERFFMILERSCEDPKLHIDLLELAYLCLSLGYEGKYRKKNGGQHDLSLWIDKLYFLIREDRGDFSKRLFMAPTAKKIVKKIHWRWSSPWFTLLITALMLLSIYLPYHIKLNHLLAPIELSLQSMLPTDEPSTSADNE